MAAQIQRRRGWKTTAVVLSFIFGAFLTWLYWPVTTRKQPLYMELAKPRKKPLAKRPPSAQKPVVHSEILSPLPTPSPVNRYSEIARVACHDELVKSIFESARNSGDCMMRFGRIDDEIKMIYEQLIDKEYRLDMETCIATDNFGEVTDLVSGWDDLSAITKMIVRTRGKLPMDEDTRRRLERVKAVGICSLKKSLDYWEANPDEIPTPEILPSSIFFNPYTGRPENSIAMSTFIQVLKMVMRRQPTGSNPTNPSPQPSSTQ